MSEQPKADQEPKFEIPAGTDKKLLRKEFMNLLQHVQDGTLLNKQQRNRLQVLNKVLSGQADYGENDLDEAEKAGAFRDTPDGKSTPRCTKAERMLRLALVTQWVVRNRPRPEMIKSAAIKWGISATALDNYVKSVRKHMEERHERTRSATESLYAEQYQRVFQVALDSGEVGAAINALDGGAKLLGLNKPTAQRFEFSGPDGEPMAVLNLPVKGSVPPGIEPS